MSSRTLLRPNLFVRTYITDILKSLDPNAEISSEAEELATNIAIDFVDSLTKSAIGAAEHRNSEQLDVQDVNYVLRNIYGINFPGEEKEPESHPTSEYQDMLSAVRALQENRDDD